MARSIYNFYREHGFGWMQFIPCLCRLTGRRRARACAVAKDIRTFSDGDFRLLAWRSERGRFVSIRHLDNWMAILLGGQPACCGMVGRCSIQFVVEGDGGVYPCDFYVLDEWRIGTVGEQSFAKYVRGGKRRGNFWRNRRSCRRIAELAASMCCAGMAAAESAAKEKTFTVNLTGCFFQPGKRSWNRRRFLSKRKH